MAEVTPQDIQQLQLLIDEARKSTGHLLTPPDERESKLAFSFADQVLKSIEDMRRSIAKDKSIKDARAVLRLSIASVIHSQVLAVRDGRNRMAAATAPADKPMAFHSVTVECFHDETFKVRVESGILKYEGDQPVECVDVKSYGPSHDRRTASQAAHDVIVGARMLSMAIADQPLTKVAEGISP